MRVLELEWKGKPFTLNEDEAFRAADAVEDVVTVGELAAMRADGNKMRFAKLAMAYAALLREAGAQAQDREVHSMFMEALKDENSEDRTRIWLQAVDTLLMILMDGIPEAEASGGEKKDKPA
jgi:hypothetical protein